MLKAESKLTRCYELLCVTQRTNGSQPWGRRVRFVALDPHGCYHGVAQSGNQGPIDRAEARAEPVDFKVLRSGGVVHEHGSTGVPASPQTPQDIDPGDGAFGPVNDGTVDAVQVDPLDSGVNSGHRGVREQHRKRLLDRGPCRGVGCDTGERQPLSRSIGHRFLAGDRRPAGDFGRWYFSPMLSPTSTLRAELAAAVDEYQVHGNPAHLRMRLRDIAASTTPEALVTAAEPYRDIPEVAAPIYEQIVSAQPTNARALVILANAYWLTGRGPDLVGELANRAIAADASNRGAWHLWALSESEPRQRLARWQQVVTRFPADDLARAALADNAASLAGAEHDYDALDLAIQTYEHLLGTATTDAQRQALSAALTSLRGWKL